MSSGRYMAYSPSPSAPHSPHIGAASALVEQEKYLSELLAERNKLSPFIAVLPNCYRLLNQGEFVIQTSAVPCVPLSKAIVRKLKASASSMT
ncbi:UNVERIFIED_CONTAM: KH domain-containing protein [Sesamum radiatum]|uniref:KH domain-containing protein n=1 Tax=Sesamum radiatum TaxID=300843 RepID=A0AAW2KIV7_SESRA